MKKIIRVFFLAIQAWLNDHLASAGAALAYYSLFSLSPLLVIVVLIASLFWGEAAIKGEIHHQLSGLMGEHIALSVEDILKDNYRLQGHTWPATVVGVFILIIGSTSVFSELESVLNRIWGVGQQDKKRQYHKYNIWLLLRGRVLAFILVLGLGLLLVATQLIDVVLSIFSHGPWPWVKNWHIVINILNSIVTFLSLVALFSIIYKILPRVNIAWSDVWVGSLVTAILFCIGKILVTLYLQWSAVASSYGAAGSMVAILIWFYYSAQIFLLGAEFTKIYARS